MDKFTIGMTVIIVGMGGTMISLGLLSLLIDLMKKLLPFKESEETNGADK